MDKHERVIDLKREERFIEEYVSLRNRYSEFLLTKPVNLVETKEWLKDNQIEIRGFVRDGTLLGVVILYINRDGEIAFFAKDQNLGMGSKLLHIISEVAEKKNLKSIWGWVLKDNFLAQRVFGKNGFINEGLVERMYEGVIREGIRYKKIISKSKYNNDR